jgi:PPOX class probable F420-dependent enzyme
MSNKLTDGARKFLQERRFAVLGTINKDGSPHLTTMWYLLEGDTIVMNTKVGRLKEQNIRRDPRVSICVEDEGYITISGSVEIIDDPQTAQHDIYRLAVRYDGEEAAKRQIAETFSHEQRITLHLKCEHIIEDLR